MLVSQIVLSSLLITSIQAAPFKNPAIQWSSCQDPTLATTTVNHECGTLTVPLDYTDPFSNATIELELVKIPAPRQPAKGSILFNFGGPGPAARGPLLASASQLLAATGLEHDLLAFDPRGTGNTIPFTCNLSEVELILRNDILEPTNSSDTSLVDVWAQSEAAAKVCYERSKDHGAFIGTASVARDLISVVDSLDEDGLLRFWGISYGSVLGATVASMFPDRIDKLIIDGVQNTHEYYHAPADFEEWLLSDEVFSGIWSTCIDAGPELCSLSSLFETATEMEDSVWQILDDLKSQPVAIGTNTSFVLDYKTLKYVFAQSLYNMGNWPIPVAIIESLLLGNKGADLLELVAFLAPTTSESWVEKMTLEIAAVGIHCSDRTWRAETLDEYMPAVFKLRNTSRILGDTTDSVGMPCAQWPLNAKERYGGNFNVKTKNPMLILANTYDGYTPIASARNASAGFEGSVVLEINGYGHGSTTLPSVCSTKATAAYFVNGTMPDLGTVCEVDAVPYGNITKALEDVLLEVIGNDGG